MNPSQNSNIVPIIKKEQLLTKEQERFNRLNKKLQKLQLRYTENKDIAEYAHQKIAELLYAQKRKTNIIIIEAIKHVHDNYDKIRLKRDKKRFSNFILVIMDDIYKDALTPEITSELQILAQFHFDQTATKKEKQENEEYEKDISDFATELIKTTFGIDVDINDIKENPEEFQRRVQEKIQQQMQEEEVPPPPKKPKSKAQIKREEKEQENKKNISKNVREIYTQLVKQLHPDLEKDEVKRLEKTETLQKITQAYESNNFFLLLQYQLQYIDNANDQIASLEDSRLKYYNQLLEEQIEELDTKINNILCYGNEEEFVIGFWEMGSHFFANYCDVNKEKTLKVIKKREKKLISFLKHIEGICYQAKKDLEEVIMP
ncbi:MAG: hypothetical protein IPL35_10650 [Sphingobacteriales bacterium]|nr:hypothetical protein [Sphingobacteriales bacterium]